MYEFKVLLKENDGDFPDTNTEEIVKLSMNIPGKDYASHREKISEFLNKAYEVFRMASDYNNEDYDFDDWPGHCDMFEINLRKSLDLKISVSQAGEILEARTNGANLDTFVDIFNILFENGDEYACIESLPTEYVETFVLNV